MTARARQNGLKTIRNSVNGASSGFPEVDQEMEREPQNHGQLLSSYDPARSFLSYTRNHRKRGMVVPGGVGEVFIMDITPDVAKFVLNNLNYEGQRKLKTNAIARYENDIASGQWKWIAEAIKFDSTMRLIDGQNRLTALVRASKKVDGVVLENELVSIVNEPDAFKYIDQNEVRNMNDVTGIVSRSHGVNPPHASVVSALIREQCNFDHCAVAAVPRPRRVEIALSHPFIDLVSSLKHLTIPGTSRNPPAPILAAAVRCMRVSPDHAFEFFRAALQNDTVFGEECKPARALHSLILRSRNISSAGVARDYSARCMRAFVQYWKGRHSSVIRWNGGEMPITEDGKCR